MQLGVSQLESHSFLIAHLAEGGTVELHGLAILQPRKRLPKPLRAFFGAERFEAEMAKTYDAPRF